MMISALMLMITAAILASPHPDPARLLKQSKLACATGATHNREEDPGSREGLLQGRQGFEAISSGILLMHTGFWLSKQSVHQIKKGRRKKVMRSFKIQPRQNRKSVSLSSLLRMREERGTHTHKESHICDGSEYKQPTTDKDSSGTQLSTGGSTKGLVAFKLVCSHEKESLSLAGRGELSVIFLRLSLAQ